MFSCKKCRHNKIRNTVIKTRKLALANNLTRFLTLTTGGKEIRKLVSPGDSFYRLMTKFKELKYILKRDYGFELKYICFLRAHKDGYCHLHVLIDKYIPKAILNDILIRIKSGWCNIKYVDPQRVSAYLSAYLERKDHEWFIPKGQKHYTMSKDLSFEKFVPEDTWTFIYTFPKALDPINATYRSLIMNGCSSFFTKPPPNIFKLHYPNAIDKALVYYYLNDYKNSNYETNTTDLAILIRKC